MQPVRIKVGNDNQLLINWDDKSESKIGLEKLRKLCPCATCMTNREKQSKTYIPLLMENQVKVAKINQVGSYAISIAWKDGHNTGIYEYPFLKKLADD
ncbi:MAG: hypothetical protein A2330_09025 [Ignavibacteria bacterium RIFOXYB2_FULL_36_7]|nr:MAG: hypothetical protein A2330_09025 [Ignavibacteria bacterium RIFOXYB2_FULL_36_7]